MRVAKVKALLEGRAAPTSDEIASLALPVLCDRILANHLAVGDSVSPDQIIEQLLRDVSP